MSLHLPHWRSSITPLWSDSSASNQTIHRPYAAQTAGYPNVVDIAPRYALITNVSEREATHISRREAGRELATHISSSVATRGGIQAHIEVSSKKDRVARELAAQLLTVAGDEHGGFAVALPDRSTLTHPVRVVWDDSTVDDQETKVRAKYLYADGEQRIGYL